MLTLTPHPEGWVLPIRAQPGARKRGIQGERGGALRVAVTAPPQDGRANESIAEVLREAFKLKRSELQLVSGEKSRNKSFLVRGLTREQLEARLAGFLQNASK
jgi:uncharacterized protein (TIGR00251 family)